MFINCFVVVKFWFVSNVFEKILLNIFVDSKNSTLFVGYFLVVYFFLLLMKNFVDV